MTTYIESNEEFKDHVTSFMNLGAHHPNQPQPSHDYGDPELNLPQMGLVRTRKGLLTDESDPRAAVAHVTEDKLQGFAAKFVAVDYDEDIDSEVASSLPYILSTRLPEKPLAGLMDKYKTSRNAKTLCAPRVNAQI